MKKITFLLIIGFLSLVGNTIYSQVSGDFRSNASGNWNDYTKWYKFNGSTWAAAVSGETPTASSSVFIQSAHTMTLTQNEACNDLHISIGVTNSASGARGYIALGTNTLSVNGKIRSFYAAVGTVPGTSATTGYGTYPFTASGSGKISIVGNTRNLTNTGEWGATITAPSTGSFPLEINLNSGQTVTAAANIKCTNLNVVAGTFTVTTMSLDNGTTGQGNCTIAAGATLTSSATGTSAFIQRTNSTAAGTFTLNGTLSLGGTAPTMAMSIINFNGTVEFAKLSSQTLLGATYSGATPYIYTNIRFLGGGTAAPKSSVASSALVINGTLTLLNQTNLTLGASGTLTYGSNATIEYAAVGNNQTITPTSGEWTATPKNIIINNTFANGTVTMSTPKSIAGTLTLSNGKLVTDATNFLTLTNTAAGAVVGGSATCYVKGPLARTLPNSYSTPSTYVFPVGAATYYPFSLVNPTTGATGPVITVTATASTSGGSAGTGLSSISTAEYWSAIVNSGNYTGGSVSLGRQTTLSSLNAIGQSSTLTGAYANLNGTVSDPNVTSSDNTGAALGYFVFGQKNASATPPTLTFESGQTVDSPINITFPTDGTWEAAINSVKIAGTALTVNTDYDVSSGQIQLKPAGGNSLVKTPGSKEITVVAGGYSNATITQTILVGAAAKLAMKTQPASPTINGAVLTTQPAVYIQDQYGNTTASTANVVAATGSGTWTLGGTTTVAGSSGTSTFSGLTATSAAGVTDATIAFSSAGLTGIESAAFDIPTPVPTITVSTNTLTGFSYIYTSGPSVSQSFTVNGIYMSTGITVTPSVNYEVSTDNSSFSLSPIVIGAAGTINNTTIYVRLAAELSAANYNSQAITLSSTSATDKIVTCSGSVPTPTISTSVSSLNGLNYGFSYGPSASQSFTVTSSNLPNDVTVTAPTNFEVSLSAGGTYSSSVSVTKNNATVPVYVRLVSGLSLATYSGTNITVASTGVTTLDVAVSGTVGSPIIKVGVSAGADNKNVVTLVAYSYNNGPSASLSGMLVSGDYLQSDVTATAPTNFEVSKNNSTFADFVTFTMSNQTVSGQLWVRLKAGLNTDTYSGNIVFSSTGAPNRIVIPTGYVTGGPQLTTGVLSSGSFNYAGNGPGTERTFALSGTNIASDVTITPSANFEVSLTTGSGFSSTPLTALQADVTAGTTIYVRMKAGIAPNTYNEAITISATSANTRTVSVSGTVSSLISLSPTSNLNVNYAGNGPSPEYSFTVTGDNMAGNITVTPPADYEVSTTSGSGYLLTPFTISPSSGAISQILYFRLKAGLAPAAYSAENIALSAATATTKNFTCSGTVSPLLTTSVSTMTGFSAVFGAGTSLEQGFTITGTNAASDVTVTPPANYEISTGTDGSFVAQNPITILQASAATPTTIYVRLAAGLSVADYAGVNIVVTATGVTSKNVSLSGYVVAATAATDDYRSLASGNWSDNSSWESKAIGSTHWSAASLTPTSSATSVLIQNGHTITLTSPLTIGAITINNGGTLAANATLTANGNVTVDGTFQLNAGGWATGSGTWTYSGGTLAFNNTSSYGVNSGDVFWPTTAGPTNINILQGGLTLNSGANRTVSGLFQTAAGVTLSGATLTLNGIAQINAGGYFANAPIYGVSSTLKYNTGNTYGRGTEWASPANVQLSNNSTLDYPNTGSGAFSTNLSISGNLTVDAGSALYMDYGGSNKSGSLTVTGNVILNGALSLGNALGGDLYVGGNWTTPATNSSLNSNSRAVIFNGTGSQVINHASVDVFPYLIINNFTNGVSIANSLTATNLTIKPKAKLTLDAEKTLTSTAFTIESNATGTGTYIDNGTSTVTSSTVQNYLASARNWYLSSPVSGATTSAGNTYLKYVENGNNGTAWTPVNTGTSFTKMVGYIAQAPSANTINFTGTLNNGDQSITGLTSSGTAKVGFNLIGNPYPSYVNWDHAANTKTNVGASIWYRTKNNATTPVYVFDTYGASAGIGTNLNGLGDVTANIPPMQAFWVKVNAGQTGTVGFTNEARSHADNALPNNKFRVSSANNAMQKVLRLQVTNGTNSDEAIVLFNPNALNELDDYDSQKMSNGNVAIPEIYTTIGAEKFVINGMNNFNLDQKIPLGFSTGQLNLFTIKATQISNFDADTKIFLKDNLQNIEKELTVGSDYSFNSDVTSTENRFSLIFKSAASTTDLKNSYSNLDQDIIVFKNANNHITVQYVSNFYTGTSVSVYNSTGQKLITQNLTSTVTEINSPLSSGVYLVVVSNSVSHFTRKVTIN